MSLVNVSEVVPFLAFVCLLMFAEKIPVHLIFAAMCFAMYVVKQQLTAEFNAHVERLTADLTTQDATFVVEGQRILTMIMTDNNYSLDDMCNMVSVEIRSLGVGKISKETIKNFYYNNGDFRGSTLNKIGAWIDSKNNFNLANNSE
ncbi:hypothetical protein F8M41_004022 [Gigaspora margarita]|uniref:Uncharacterized protein n=1 Tax=Gigaspora margarita TaxID=4874 RepID=A0A8H4A7Z3_GIGMA|nr:hypothetical protein F8M41_004022 [Gigaspora margarita]